MEETTQSNVLYTKISDEITSVTDDKDPMQSMDEVMGALTRITAAMAVYYSDNSIESYAIISRFHAETFEYINVLAEQNKVEKGAPDGDTAVN